MLRPAFSILSFFMFGFVSNSFAQDTSSTIETRPLFNFKDSNSSAQWQVVNDGVMGGRSTSRVERTADGTLRFSGNLSLENNGGFASMRSRPRTLGLSRNDSIRLRVKGDGRTYTFNLYVPQRQMAFSYRTEFSTVAGQWTEVQLPLNKFVATSFGRVVRNATLVPAQINSVGILLGDKKPGGFNIEIESIGVQ